MTTTQHEEGSLQSLGLGSGLDPSDPAFPGQATYTPSFLAHVYDPLVVGLANRFVWRCPSTTLTRLYDEHVTDSHLDVGPGTGYYLARCRFPTARPEITLLDPNPAVLLASSARLARYSPRVHQANVLLPVELPPASFGSIGLAHVVHCLPGTIESKACVFENLAPLLRPGGVIFGSTVLADRAGHTVLSRRVMAKLNGKGLFTNQHDHLAGLEHALTRTFTDVRIRKVGAMALFSARTGG